jgi:hypothetical protein
LETLFLLDEKRSIRTQNFHRKNTFHDLFRGPEVSVRVQGTAGADQENGQQEPR